MQIENFKIFADLVETRSFSKAAKLNGITQSAVSQQTRAMERLFKELLIGVTRFFRDPEVWKQLRTEILPALLAAHPEGAVLRAWTAGCSTGEEAYSLAMLFTEAGSRPGKK